MNLVNVAIGAALSAVSANAVTAAKPRKLKLMLVKGNGPMIKHRLPPDRGSRRKASLLGEVPVRREVSVPTGRAMLVDYSRYPGHVLREIRKTHR